MNHLVLSFLVGLFFGSVLTFHTEPKTYPSDKTSTAIILAGCIANPHFYNKELFEHPEGVSGLQHIMQMSRKLASQL